MAFHIRVMRASDADAVLRIYDAGIQGGIATFETACPDDETWDRMHLRECRLVAAMGEEVIGFAALSGVSFRHAYRGVAEISIYIDPAWRGKGFGKALLTRLLKEAEIAGFWTLQSTIIAINLPSIRLHIACGFREVGRRERIARDLFGNWQDTILMEFRNGID